MCRAGPTGAAQAGFGCRRSANLIESWLCSCSPFPLRAEQDRRERRKRLGLPEELTEEEKEAERQKAAAKAAEEARRKLPVKPVVGEGGGGGAGRVCTIVQCRVQRAKMQHM